MPLLEQFLSESHVKAIAAMLFHSLWQGLLLAIAAAAVLLLTKKASAVLRYNLLVTLLFLFAAGSVYTCWSYLQGVTENIPVAATYAAELNELQAANKTFSSRDIVTNTINLFHSHAPIIVFSWLLLIFIRLCFIITGYYTVHRFSRNKLAAPPQKWKDRWTDLTAHMHIRMGCPSASWNLHLRKCRWLLVICGHWSLCRQAC